MGNELDLQDDTLKVDSYELLIRFLIACKNKAKDSEFRTQIMSSADIISAIYFYRKFPNIEEFLEKFMTYTDNYFQIQWTRKLWIEFSKMTDVELCKLVINKISLVANSE